MCRANPSAHGRISTALSAGAFPHDSADPPPAGPGRMCNTAQAAPMPHTRARPRPASSFLTAVAGPLRAPEPGSTRPDTADPHPHRTHPPASSRRSRPTPEYSWRERLGALAGSGPLQQIRTTSAAAGHVATPTHSSSDVRRFFIRRRRGRLHPGLVPAGGARWRHVLPRRPPGTRAESESERPRTSGPRSGAPRRSGAWSGEHRRRGTGSGALQHPGVLRQYGTLRRPGGGGRARLRTAR